MGAHLVGKSDFYAPSQRPAESLTLSYCPYRLAWVLRSSWNFKLRNYVADSRRRAKFKLWIDFQPPAQLSTHGLIPINQLLYLLWNQSTNISIMCVANDSLRSAALRASSSASILDRGNKNNSPKSTSKPTANQRRDRSSSPDFKSGRDDGSDAW
eukprot:scaffold26710_cov113-Skeletonema_menzelii.AAC.3